MALALSELAHAESGGQDFNATLMAATKATGPEYFDLKKQLLKADRKTTEALRNMEDEDLPYSQRMLARVLREELTVSEEQKAGIDQFYLLLGVADWKDSPHVYPTWYVRLFLDNPRTIPEGFPEAKMLRVIVQCPLGFLYEVMFKHDQRTLLDASADIRVRQHNEAVDEATKKAKRGDYGRFPIPPRWDRETFIRTAPTWPLEQARILAARALVFDGSDEAVAMLEEAARRWAQYTAPSAADCLEFIGSPPPRRRSRDFRRIANRRPGPARTRYTVGLAAASKNTAAVAFRDTPLWEWLFR
jgi:hypothetical protein